MAIYPVIAGQKFNHKNVIPPRASISELRAQPVEAPSGQGDLIDFGDDGLATQQPPSKGQSQIPGNQPPPDPLTSSAKEGPLVDFHQDMKKDLPSSIKRTNSTESDDEFVDAQG